MNPAVYVGPSGSDGDSSTSPRRDVVLEETAGQAARAWTSSLFGALAGDGRPVEGGWPGTVPEARGRIAAFAARTLEGMSLPPLTSDELSHLTRITYEEARRIWRAEAGRAKGSR